jgi:hypothetical protein
MSDSVIYKRVERSGSMRKVILTLALAAAFAAPLGAAPRGVVAELFTASW